MVAFNYAIVSFGGTAMSTFADYAVFDVQNGPMFTAQQSAIEASIPGLGDRDVRGQSAGATYRILVSLSDTSEAILKLFYECYSEERGQQFLIITDGSGVSWRTAGRVLRIEARNMVQHEVVLRVADPRWQENTATTDSKLNQTASPIAISLTNAGNRKARPLFTFIADAAKTINSRLYDWPYTTEGFFVNRSPKDFSGPIWLGDQLAAAARFDSSSSAAGASVRQTTGATTTTADPGAGGLSIAVTQLSGFNANGGLAVLEWVIGSTYGTMELVRYTGKSAGSGAGNLTGVTRGLGGTTAQAHTIGVAINPAGSMPNGDDCRVWLDDVPDVTRYLVAWNSAASDVVLPNVSLPAAGAYTLVAAMTASAPANGSEFTVNQDISQLPSKGFVAIDSEVIYFASRAGRTLSGIQRAQWGTTAATHVTASSVWANPRHFIIGVGYGGATPPPAPPAQRPACQLPASSNQLLYWGDQADDPSTIYFDRNAPDRSAQWVPGFDLDGNAVSPLMQLFASGTIATWKDDVPGDGSPPYNFLEIAVPAGIRFGNVNAIRNDWTPAAEILNLELWTRDAGGVLKLQDQLMQAAADTGRTLPAPALATTAYGCKLKARYMPHTGHRGSGSTSLFVRFGNPAFRQAQKFEVKSAARLKSATYRVQCTGAGTQNYSIQIRKDTGGLPAVGNVGDAVLGYVTGLSHNSTSPATYTTAFGTPIDLAAGSYWFVISAESPDTTPLIIISRADPGRFALYPTAVGDSSYSWTLNTSAQLDRIWVLLNTDYNNDNTAPISSDQPARAPTTALRTGITASMDKTIILIEPLQTVYVHRNTLAATPLHHVDGLLTNATTGDTMLLDKWLPLAASLAIDCDLRTVIATEAGVSYPVTKACVFSNTADWMALAPGANSLSYADAGLIAPGQMDIVSTFRGTKV